MAEATNTKVAVVTGSNKGLGFAIVKRLCADFKGDVYLTSRNVQNGQEAVKKLQDLGLKVNYHQLDIEDLESIKKLAAFLKEKYGGLDVLINNAAVFKIAPDDSLEKQAVYCNNINFLGTLNACKVLFPILKPNARVINMSSRLGMLTSVKSKELREKLKNKDLQVDEIVKIMNDYVEACKKGKPEKEGFAPTPYGMSKVCVTALSKVQQREFDNESPKRGVTVNAVCPGYCKTEMTNNKGFLTADQGADTPCYLAVSGDFKGPNGALWAERALVLWEDGSLAGEYLKKAPYLIKAMFSK